MQLVSQSSDPRPANTKGIAVARRGFTIVELLIVIVVIAILAAITIVAYNGIQQRANNAKTVSAVDAYIKLLDMYKIDNGDFPKLVSCLGVGYDGGTCRDDGDVFTEDHGGLNSVILKPYLNGAPPSPATTRYPTGYSAGTTYIAGAYYVNPAGSSYGAANGAGIGVMLSGNSCPTVSGLVLGSSQVSGGAIACRYGLN